MRKKDSKTPSILSFYGRKKSTPSSASPSTKENAMPAGIVPASSLPSSLPAQPKGSTWWDKKPAKRTLSMPLPPAKHRELPDRSIRQSSHREMTLGPQLGKYKPKMTSQSIVARRTNSGSTTPGKTLSPQQQAVLNLALQGVSVFYTGAAGTGKSHLLHTIIGSLRQRYPLDNAVAVTATTGLAAQNLSGQTIYSWGMLGVGNDTVNAMLVKLKKPFAKAALSRWQQCRVLIVDEISMLPGGLLDKMEQIARSVRNSSAPFGGIQLIFTGDFFQLPPVDKERTGIKLCFEADCWNRVVGDNQMLLDTVFRQKGDSRLIRMLNALRTGLLTPDIIQEFKALSRQVNYEDGLAPTQLFPLRQQVTEANNTRMRELEGRIFTYNAYDACAYPDDRAAKQGLENLMAVSKLELKIGAQVLLIQNLREDGLVNGSRGKVVTFAPAEEWPKLREWFIWKDKEILDIYNGILNADMSQGLEKRLKGMSSQDQMWLYEVSRSPDELYPVVDFGNGIIRLVSRERFKVSGPRANQQDIAERNQVPLILSWALSIHKAQGQTIDRLVVDLRRVFEKGQAYVAVSRATSCDRLQITGFNEKLVHVDKRVTAFYDKLKCA